MTIDNRNKKILVLSLIFSIVLIDQALKICVKTNMMLGESIQITNWFYLRFIENNGMGGGEVIINKIFQTLLRFIFFSLIVYGLNFLIKKNYKTKYIICVSLIVAGALGNLIDQIFYGVIFGSSDWWQVATLFPSEGGYSTWLYGKNVEMFYFPIIDTTIGGKEIILFRYIFNFSDVAIYIGLIMGLILIFRKNPHTYIFSSEENENEKYNLDINEIEFIKEPYRNKFSGIFHIFIGYVLLVLAIVVFFINTAFPMLIINWILLFISLHIIFYGKRLMVISGQNMLTENEKSPLVLYLRPFNLDNHYTRNIHTLFVSLPFVTKEMKIVKVLRSKGSVIAIGKPGEKYASLGASRLYVAHHLWQEKVMKLIEESKLILLALGYSKSLIWELDTISKHTVPEKFYLYFPLSEYDSSDREKYWSFFLESYVKYSTNPFIQFPQSIGNIAFFKFDAGWTPIPITKPKRKITWIKRYFEWSFFGLILKSLFGLQHNRDCKLLKKMIS
jgi:signal peptidase II